MKTYRTSPHLKRKVATTAAAIYLTLGALNSAHALPLLSESAALNVGAALTLYPDHEDHNKFYFMPNSSKIGRDSKGVPTFSFTYYGLADANSKDAGAFMAYVGRLTSDPDQAQALAQFLKTNPQAGVAVLAVKESTISLTSTASGLPLAQYFTEFNFSQKGGRAEDEIGINAVLTRIGAKVFKASLLGEVGAAMKTDMCYKVQGLGPSMDGQISVDMNFVYDHFKASASAGALWWRATVQVEIEKLVTQRKIRWEINGGEAKDEDYIREAAGMIIEKMFTPQLKLSPAGGSEVWDKITPFQVNASYTHKEENNTLTWSIKRRALETREFCVPLTIKDIQAYKNQCVINAD